MLLLAALWLQSPPEPAPVPASRRPNIVLAIADDLDPDHLGFCGNPLAVTPALDELAAQGTVVSVLYAQPVCRLGLATLLSGRWPHQTGIVNNQTQAKLDPRGVLPARLRDLGYATFCGGKFWEGEARDYGFGAPEQREDTFLRDQGAGRAELERFLEAERERPWFVWWAPSLPHFPHRAPVRFQKRFESAQIPVPSALQGEPEDTVEDYVEAERALLAMECWLDAEFRALLAKLDQLGEREETLIVFLADNGWSTHLPSKGTAFEKGVRSPLVLSLPAELAARAPRRVEALADLVDVTATLLDYAGIPDPSLPGRSLRPWLEGKTGPSRALLCGAAYTRFGEEAPTESAYALYARDRRWKYVLYLADLRARDLSPDGELARPWRARRGHELLFDLEADPFELTDLAANEDQAARKAALRAGLLAWWQETGGGALALPEEK